MFGPDGPSFRELARQALSSTDHGYALLAPKFDHTPFRTPDDLLAQVADHVGPTRDLVDLCCGTGAALAAFAPNVRGRLVGVDRVPAMLDIARERVTDRAELIASDVLHWDGDQAFDVAVCFGAFGHILPHQQAAFRRAVWRALRPGGRFVFITGRNPGPLHPTWWAARAFNGAMHVRNALIDPPFHMYYLTFLWPEVGQDLARDGFEVTLHEQVFEAPYRRALLVEAHRPVASS